jgi:dTDP-4-amino-4,6-dideoxygalactose transaminase
VAYSFQAIKHLTTGDGGLLVTPPSQYERAVLLRWYGLDRTQGDAMRCRQDIQEAGYKFHMNDINATIGLGNIGLAKEAVERHRKNAEYYNDIFVPMGLVPEPKDDRNPAYWVYTLHVRAPLAFESYMRNKGIAVSQVHNRNDHYSCFSKYKTELPKLDAWFSTMSAIPVGWWLEPKDLRYIVDSVKLWVELNNDKYDYPGF